MAIGRSRVREHCSIISDWCVRLGDELPVIACRMQRDAENAEGIVVEDARGVRQRLGSGLAVVPSPCSDDEFTNPAICVDLPLVIAGFKSLIRMAMPVQDEVGIVFVQGPPERA